MYDENEPRPHHYATPLSDGFSMFLDGEHVKAENKVMKLTEAQHNELQKLMRSGRPDIVQNMQLIDMAAAEVVAREHIARHSAHATQGAHSTGAAVGGKDPAALGDVPKVSIPDPGQGEKKLTALQQRLMAKSGAGNAAQIVPNPDEKKPLVVVEEGNAIHPEDMTPEQLAALATQHDLEGRN